MTPYRVLAEDDSGNQTILVAMLSKDRTTGQRRIFIVQKPLSTLIVPSYEDKRRLAHALTTRGNSFIETRYLMRKNDEGTRYEVFDHNDRKIFMDYYIQSDCLLAALRDYLAYAQQALRIVDVL